MKKVLLLFTALAFVSHLASAQMTWLNDYNIAKAVAIEKDQLILIDFWAVWCGPCKRMDKEMWEKPEVIELSKKFVPLKVDIDFNRGMATEFQATSIPKVMVITVKGEILWENVGYSSSTVYEEMMTDLPEALNGLNKKLAELKKFDETRYFEVGRKYQELAKIAANDFKSAFFNLSDSYFKKVAKKSEDGELVTVAEMNIVLNEVFGGKIKKAMKKVDKIDVSPENEKAAELKNFIMAYCYKCEDEKEKFSTAKSKIADEAYLEELAKLEEGKK